MVGVKDMTNLKDVKHRAKCAKEDIFNLTFRKTMVFKHGKDFDGKSWIAVSASEVKHLAETYQRLVDQAASNYVSYCSIIGQGVLEEDL